MTQAREPARQRILAIDDDPGIRSLVSHVLARAGYDVTLAADGAEGIRSVHAQIPDLVLCDVGMPVMDGFATLESVRASRSTVAVPFILLTALDDRQNVLRGMRLGADDFLSKPVRPEELVQAVRNALERRSRLRALESAAAPPKQRELQRGASAESDLAGITGRMMTQSVLFTDIRGFTAISERLPVTDIAELLSRYLHETCVPIIQEGGRIMKIAGDGVMAAFGIEAPEDAHAHAVSALRAGLRILEVVQEFRSWVARRFELSGLPQFDVGIGIHTGEVLMFQLAVGGVSDLTAIGDTVNVAARLESMSKVLGWPMVASMDTLEAAGSDFEVAETRVVEVAGREAKIRVGRLAAPLALTPLPAAQRRLASGIRAALDENAQISAAAAKAALDSTLRLVGERLSNSTGPRRSEPVVRGYRVLAKIGEGGMSTVYLAEEQAKGRKAVLKILNGRRNDDDETWKRFFQECAIISSIRHPHVVSIYDQGFGEDLAYIAMEHLGGGSLRQLMDRGLAPRQALELLSQAAGALSAIHERGIVHRDIKPANLMLRESGVLVLTDFGVAKRLDYCARHTLHGEVLGTPRYISPEQAQGKEVTPRADLYSLGVIFFEMIAGVCPYESESLQEIFAMHVVTPIPRLPPRLAVYQSLVDGMLAKRPEDRFENADAVLKAIDEMRSAR